MKKNRVRKWMVIMMASVWMASSLTAGCGTDAKEQKETEQDQSSANDAAEDDKTPENEKGAEKTEVSREDFPDCDGSGHGYVEIHYSDGSVETEEY